ncbi:MAG: hypothetical protein FWG25_08845, partial [Promicromonosporaceae bacterium]|nr:hypothetical protein [Promicromonosporaceae bacterium]
MFRNHHPPVKRAKGRASWLRRTAAVGAAVLVGSLLGVSGDTAHAAIDDYAGVTVQVESGTWFEAVFATWPGTAGNYTAEISQDGGAWVPVDQELVRETSPGNWRVDVPGLAANHGQTYALRILSGDEVIQQFAGLTPEPFNRQGFAFYTGEVHLYDGTTRHFPNGTTGGNNPDGSVPDNAEIIYVTHDNMYVLSDLSNRTVPTIVRFIGRVGRAGGELPYVSFQHHLPINNSQNITFEGVGPDAIIDGWGILPNHSDNIIIRNLTWENSRHDSIWLRGPSTHSWVTHNTFLINGDGSSDMGSGTTNFTISYNQYIGTVEKEVAPGKKAGGGAPHDAHRAEGPGRAEEAG